MTTNTKAFNDDLSKYYPYFLLFGLYIVLYLPCLTNYSISIDDEAAFWRKDSSVWLAQGRIISFFIEKNFIKQPTVIFFAEFFFGICSSFSYIFILRAFGRSKIELFDIVFFGIFCAFPVWYFIFEFYANMPAASIGLLSCSIGVFFLSKLFDRFSVNNSIYSVLCFFISISSYQAFLFYISVCVFSLYIYRYDRTTLTSLKKLLLSIIILIFSVFCYFFVLKILLNIYKVNVFYIQSFADFGLLFGDTKDQIYNVFFDIFKMVFSNKQYFIVYMPGVAVIVILYFLILLSKKRFFNLLLSLALLLIPFIMHLTAHDWPLRAQLASSFVIWFFIFYSYCNSQYLGKIICFIVACSTLVQIVYFISYNTSNQKLAYQHDVVLATRISERVAEVVEYPQAQILIDVYGSIPFKTNLKKIPLATTGASFFEWDGGSVDRIAGFMRLIGYDDIMPLHDDTNKMHYFIEYLKMPSWPARGSVKRIGDVVLIKLSDDPNPKYQAMDNVTAGNVVPLSEYNDENILSKSFEVHDLKSADNRELTATGNDAQIILKFDRERIKDCKILQLKADLTVEKPTVYQIYYLRRGERQFSEKGTQLQYLNGGHNSVTMTIGSGKGFENILRVDPVNNIQKFKLNRLSISCVE